MNHIYNGSIHWAIAAAQLRIRFFSSRFKLPVENQQKCFLNSYSAGFSVALNFLYISTSLHFSLYLYRVYLVDIWNTSPSTARFSLNRPSMTSLSLESHLKRAKRPRIRALPASNLVSSPPAHYPSSFPASASCSAGDLNHKQRITIKLITPGNNSKLIT